MTAKPSRASINQPQRRGFLRFLGGAVGALLFSYAGRARAKKLALPMSKVEALKKVGGSVSLDIKGQPVIFVRDTEKTVRAFDPTCTHKKCKVAYKSETGKLHCKCHKSAYDLTGKVLGGPAPAPLTQFRTKLKGDKLLIALPDPE